MNPYGEPMLIPRWGATYRDPMSEDNGLKYWLCSTEPTLVGFEFTDPVTGMELTVAKLEEVPPSILIATPKYQSTQLGERRWIIEQWRSPLDLERSGRYQKTMLFDAGTTQEFRVCFNCKADMAPTAAQCPLCGGTRTSIETIREDGFGKVLRDFPRRGCYDYFLRVETVEGKGAPLDHRALNLVRKQWADQHNKDFAQKWAETERTMDPQRLTNQRALNPRSPFQKPHIPA